jgi:hypothetical protein
MRPTLHALVATFVTALSLFRLAPAQAEQPPAVDWRAVLTADPRVQVQSRLPPGQYPASDDTLVWIVTPLFGSDPPTSDLSGGQELAGAAALGQVVYGDVAGDGSTAAVIPVYSGGTAGLIGVLVYQVGSPAPRLVSAMGGYNLGLPRIRDGGLEIAEPEYGAGAPNCCPSSFRVVTYHLAGDVLTATGERQEPRWPLTSATYG